MQNIKTTLKQQKIIVETLQKGEDGKDGKGISSVKINDKGELEIIYSDGDSVNLGVVKGSDGKNGEQGIQGVAGANGKDGKGISSIRINDNGELEITYSDGDSVNLGVVKDNPTLTASDIKATDDMSDSSNPVELSVQAYLDKLYSKAIINEQKLPVWTSEKSILTECTTISSHFVQNDLSTDLEKWIAIPFSGHTISIAFPGVSTYNSNEFGMPILGTLEDGVLGDGKSVLWSSGEKYTPTDKYGSKGITSVKFTTDNPDYNCIVIRIADEGRGYDYSDSYIAAEGNIEAWNTIEAYKVDVYNPQSGDGLSGLFNTDHYTFRDVQARAFLSNFSENEKGELLYKGKQVNSDSGASVDLSDYYTKTETDEKIRATSVDLSGYYTKTETDEKISTIIDRITAEIKGL